MSDEDDDFRTTKVVPRRGRLARKSKSKDAKNSSLRANRSSNELKSSTQNVIDLDTPPKANAKSTEERLLKNVSGNDKFKRSENENDDRRTFEDVSSKKTTSVENKCSRESIENVVLAKEVSANVCKEVKTSTKTVVASQKCDVSKETIELDTTSDKDGAVRLTLSTEMETEAIDDNGSASTESPKFAESLSLCENLCGAPLASGSRVSGQEIAANSVTASAQVCATSHAATANNQVGQSGNTRLLKHGDEVRESRGRLAESRDTVSRNKPRYQSLTARFGKPEPEKMQSCTRTKIAAENSNEYDSKTSSNEPKFLTKMSSAKSINDAKSVDTSGGDFASVSEWTTEAGAGDDMFFCHICHRELTHMNSQRRLQHINRCLDTEEITRKAQARIQQAIKKAESAVLDCPLCGEQLKTPQSRKTHIKKCAKRQQIPPDEVLALTRQQEQAYSEKLSSGDVPGVSSAAARPIASTSRHVTKPPAPRRRRKEPKSKFEEDIQTALALSSSIFEDPPGGQTWKLTAPPGGQSVKVPPAPAQKLAQNLKKRGKKNKLTEVPALVARSDQERQRLLAASVETIILETNVASAETPLLKKSRLGHPKLTVRTPRKNGALWSLGRDGPPVPRDPPVARKRLDVKAGEKTETMGLGQAADDVQCVPKILMQSPSKPDAMTLSTSATLSPGGKNQNQTSPINPVVVECDGNECDSTTGDNFRPFVDRGVNTDDYDVTCPKCDVIRASDVSMGEENPLEQTGFFANTGSESSDDEDSCLAEKSTLVRDLSAMVGSSKCSDMKILCQGHVTVPAHRFMLVARCPKLVETLGDSVLLDLSDSAEECVLTVLDYLYTGRVRVPAGQVDGVHSIAHRFSISGLLTAVNSLKNSLNAEQLVTSLVDDGCHSDDGGNDVTINEDDVAEICEFMATQRQAKGDSNNNDRVLMSGSEDDVIMNSGDDSPIEDDVIMESFHEPISVHIPGSNTNFSAQSRISPNDSSSELPDLPPVDNPQASRTMMTSQSVGTDVINLITPPLETGQSASPKQKVIQQYLSPNISNDESINLFDDSIIEENTSNVENNLESGDNLVLDLDAIDDIEKVLFPDPESPESIHNQESEILPFLTENDINEICNSPITDDEREELHRLRNYCNSVLHSPASSIRSGCSTTDKATQSDLDSESNESLHSVDASTSPMKKVKSDSKKKREVKRERDPNKVVKRRRRRTAYELLTAMSPLDAKEKRGRTLSDVSNLDDEHSPKRRRLDSDKSESENSESKPEVEVQRPEIEFTQGPEVRDLVTPFGESQEFIVASPQDSGEISLDIPQESSANNISIIELDEETEPPTIPQGRSPIRATFTLNANNSYKIDLSPQVELLPDIGTFRTTSVTPPRTTFSSEAEVSPCVARVLPLSERLKIKKLEQSRLEQSKVTATEDHDVEEGDSENEEEEVQEKVNVAEDQDMPLEDDFDLGPDPWSETSYLANVSMEAAEVQPGLTSSAQAVTPENPRPRAHPRARPAVPSPFTPMPDYDTMPTPQIKKRVQAVGVKLMPKKKMVTLLKHIYAETHQYETDPDCDTPVRPSRSEPRIPPTTSTHPPTTFSHAPTLPNLTHPRLSANYQSASESQLTCLTAEHPRTQKSKRGGQSKGKQPRGGKSVKSSKNVVEVQEVDSSSSSAESEDEDEFGGGPAPLEESIRDCEEPSSQQPDLRERVLKFLMENIDLYFKILRYQPLEFEELKSRLAESGIKIGTDRLLAILDDQCITFRMMNTRNNRQKKTTTKTNKKSAKS